LASLLFIQSKEEKSSEEQQRVEPRRNYDPDETNRIPQVYKRTYWHTCKKRGTKGASNPGEKKEPNGNPKLSGSCTNIQRFKKNKRNCCSQRYSYQSKFLDQQDAQKEVPECPGDVILHVGAYSTDTRQ
jgi:hypothetical protein